MVENAGYDFLGEVRVLGDGGGGRGAVQRNGGPEVKVIHDA